MAVRSTEQPGAVPARVRATGADAAIAITRAVTNQRIGVDLRFADSLDADRLARACRLALDAQPLLGSRFETGGWWPAWVRLDADSIGSVLEVREATDPVAEMDAFHAAEVADSGPQVAALLLRSGEGDRLGVKVSHVLADGQAAKQVAYLIADIYSALGVEPAYAPEPDLRARPSGRDVWERLSVEQRRDARKAASWVSPNWPMPSSGERSARITWSAREVGAQRFGELHAWANERGATVNDLMLTATLRSAIVQFSPPLGVPLSLMCTADLRRFLREPADLPVANISISGSLAIQAVPDEPFEQTMGRVRQRMSAWSAQSYGAGPAFMAERMSALGFRALRMLMSAGFKSAGGSDKGYPWFTNIGVLDAGRLRFEAIQPVAASMYGPATVGFGIVPVVSTYRGAVTIRSGASCGGDDAARVGRFLDGIVDELESVETTPAR